jgi:ribosomal protein S18 acetylase RimI-like enzyme
MKLRRAQLEDLGALVALHEEVHDIHLTARPDQFRTPDKSALEKRFRELLAAPDTKVWVAEVDGNVVGYAVQLFRQRPEHTVVRELRWCEIDMIGVFAAQRNQGIGKALIQTIVDDARAAGIEQVELTSWAFNADAHRAFEKSGFVPKIIRFELERS